ncbi:N-acetylneuraminate epimerase [Paraglaciecola mesophila]|uniref:N-acetylneuraminate epimerase n=1 Tax=Paraglaciecola mesophila TaxID=197222 RepID=A0A857JHK1_9ALTE|nr:galactose oxidase [Paraglaciecola mesophila]QHJ11509.1 N-acetylneuraminate epimerase [Paraglaciecola mesophila]
MAAREKPIKTLKLITNVVKGLGAAVMVMSISLGATSKMNSNYPALPEPVSNNAVASVNTSQGHFLLSFMGLGAAKTHQAVHNKVWALGFEGDKPNNRWQQKSPVPSSLPLSGRLASIAVGVGDMAFIFGGYTVDAAHNEISSPDNFRYDVLKDTYYPIAVTPVPVDDAVALVFQQRYVYLISGWHNDGNVNLVQIYDVKTDTWQQGSPFLGKPVFGHAGAIVGNNIMLCDGVKVDAQPHKRRTFSAESACYLGIIDEKAINKIDWRTVAHPTSTARYRMAAVGDEATDSAIFVGGSDNPYNYNGIGYNQAPAKPSSQVWRYDFVHSKWQITEMQSPTMDHRGLLIVGEGESKHFVTIGGMREQQKVSSDVHIINL